MYDELTEIGIFSLEDPASLPRILVRPAVKSLQAAWDRAGYKKVGWPGAKTAEGCAGGPIGGGTFSSTGARPHMRGGMRYLTDTGVDVRTDRGGKAIREPREQQLARQFLVEAPSISFRGEDINTRHIRDLWNVPNIATWGGGDAVGIALPSFRIARERLAAVAQAVADRNGETVQTQRRLLPGEEPNAYTFILDRNSNALLTRQVDPEVGALFYEAVTKHGKSNYVAEDGPNGVGGTQIIPPILTRFRAPLILPAAPGASRGFDSAMEQMGNTPPLWQRLVRLQLRGKPLAGT